MISKRIQEIASLIDNNSSVTDVGCDHGYLAIQLRKNGNEELILCLDNKKGPLSNALKNLEGERNVSFLLSEGLEKVESFTDILVIAGMGDKTAMEILMADWNKTQKYHQLIVQVNNNVDHVRTFFMENNYKIVDEKVVFDDKYYQILVSEKGQQSLTQQQIKYGPVLLARKDSAFIDYLNYLVVKYRNIIADIDPENPKYNLFQQEIREIQEILHG